MSKLLAAFCLIILTSSIALAAAETVDLGPTKISMDLQGMGPCNVEKENPSSSNHNYGSYTFTYKIFPATITASNTGNLVLIEVHQMSTPQSLDMPVPQLNMKTGLEHCVEISDMMPPGKEVMRQPYYIDGYKGMAMIINRDQKGPIYLASYSPDMKYGFGNTVIIIGSDFPLNTTKHIFESFKAQLVQNDTLGQDRMGMGNMGQSGLGLGNTGQSNISQANMSQGAMGQNNAMGQGGMMQSCMAIMQSMMVSGNGLHQGNMTGQGDMLGMGSMGQGNMTGGDGTVAMTQSPTGSKSRWEKEIAASPGSFMGIADPTDKIATLVQAKDLAAKTKGVPVIYEHPVGVFALLFVGLIGACLRQKGNWQNLKAAKMPLIAAWREQFKRSFAIAKKNVRIYYSRGPVVIFGLMFPIVLLAAFTIGRNIGIKELFPGLMGMVIFFASTAMGPGILPWETRSRNLERLVSSPISVWALFLGDVLASFIFGILISTIPLIAALAMGIKVMNLPVLCLGIILATFCFASLSILLSVYPPTDVPATVMMISSLVKFPIIFISGVFVPLEHMHEWGVKIASISPLTYFTDLAAYSTTGVSHFSVQVDLAVLTIFALFFFVVAIKLHEKFLPQRLS